MKPPFPSEQDWMYATECNIVRSILCGRKFLGYNTNATQRHGTQFRMFRFLIAVFVFCSETFEKLRKPFTFEKSIGTFLDALSSNAHDKIR